jgi:hypothetical protein
MKAESKRQPMRSRPQVLPRRVRCCRTAAPSPVTEKISHLSRYVSKTKTALADNLVHFKVTGAGTIAAVDNGNAATEEPFQADHRKGFNGLALLIVKSKPGEAGKIQVTATSAGLTAGKTEITTQE